MRSICVILFNLILFNTINAQIDAGLFRYPDVSQTHIVFTYANDIWIVPKEGGKAFRLSSPLGVEVFPKFSPDGKTIAFSGNYDGNRDVFTVPSFGGVTTRLTYHGMNDRVVDWYPDGKSILFASGRDSEKERFNKFFKIPITGGLPEKLPLAYAEYGSLSPDGKKIALTFETQIGRTWKRYRGGNVAAIHIFDLNDNASENISKNNEAGDEFPMWYQNKIYFISDRGVENRMNLWEYDVLSKASKQLTKFNDNDVHYPSLGIGEIVFEQAGKMYLYAINTGEYKEVKISLVTDGMSTKPRIESTEKYIQHASISPDGHRVLIEARGDIFSVPKEDGFVKDLTQTSGVAERHPAWSPDGKKIAYWSDRSGEYELTLVENDKEKKLTSLGAGFRYTLFWSPDSKKIGFVDKAMKIQVYDLTTSSLIVVDKALRLSHGALEGFVMDWSSDSRWITYSRDLDNYHYAAFLFDMQNKKLYQVTSGYYNVFSPVFDRGGKYIFVITDQNFTPSYSSLDNTFIYANSSNIAAVSLKKTTASPLYPKNDSVSVSSPADEKKDDTTSKKGDTKKDKDKKEEVEKKVSVEIDVDGLENRLVILPMDAGNYSNLSSIKGKLLYQKSPNTGSSEKKNALLFFDFDKRESKTIIDDIDFYQVAASGKKLLVNKENTYAIIKPEETQKMDKPLRISEMEMLVDPKSEWKQIFTDAWRLQRDYFYDPGMHGVDWNKVKDQYSKILDGAATREEVNFVVGEMIGELNSSHTYRSGGNEETEKVKSVGYLGVDWEADGQFYKIKRIVKGASWDAEVRSPLSLPGVPIAEGMYILAVNGIPITTATEPYAAFQGLGKRTVELSYNKTPSWIGAKTTLVQTLNDEIRLRHLEWIEKNRKRVEDATQGEAGYVYVRSTGIDGQNELIRQFNAQWDKKSIIIDERFNNGGQIPDRFIEMLNRPPIVFWTIRDGKSWPWPQFANFGPKVMLINGWSGSGGDAFPDYFRKAGLGPLIGTRTWGGLIGISGVPTLIDGGVVTVPTFRMLNLDGTWFKEGHGVDPDIVVDEDLTSMAKGVDPQLERAITEIKERLKKAFQTPNAPAFEVR